MTEGDRSLRWAVTLSATYLFFIGQGFLWTYMPRYFTTIGWTSTAIGVAMGVGMALRTVAMPSWARVAERTSSASFVIRLLATLGAAILWALPFVRSPWAVVLTLAGIYITWNSFAPLVDALTVRQLGNPAFGRIRAWGSAGFGFCAVGIAIFGRGLPYAHVARWAPWIIAVMGTLAALSTWGLPSTEVATRAPDLRTAFKQLRRPVLLGLLPLWMLHWASQSPYNLFFVFLCEQARLPGWTPGVAVTVGIVGEVLFLSFGRNVVDRLGPRRLFAICLAATALRWCASAFTGHVWLMVLLQFIHGLTFGGWFLSAMAVLDREVPANVRTSGQALLYVFVFGGGSALGNASAGWLVGHYDASTAFASAGVLEILILGLLAFVPTASAPPER